MEMNTRLQVEHPVTELVTGCDLVVQQLRIAANQSLEMSQDDVRLDGHAIELRINAEDPDHGFRPDPGRIDAFRPPAPGVGAATVRWDSAIESGYRIPPHYDSLIGKLIVHAGNRDDAIAEARRALSTLEVSGVRTTIPFHRRLLDDPDFRSGSYDVGFVDRLLAGGSRQRAGG